MAKANILGSCVSRIIMLNGDRNGHGISDPEIEMGYFLDKENIVCAMMKPPFSREEVEAIQKEELYDPSRIHALKQGLNKDTLKLLLESDAEYLIMDFYDFQTDMGIYKDTIFSTCAHEFFNTAVFRRYEGKIGIINFMNESEKIWYPLVDAFFESIIKKYDSDHIILNRFRSNTWYLDQDGKVKMIPESFKQPYHSNDKYNSVLAALEEYVIGKYNPYVIDLSKFFMGNANEWDNLNGAHFENAFYRRSFAQVKRIILNGCTDKYYDDPGLFEEDTFKKEECFDVEEGLRLFEELLEQEDILWMNLLAKLNLHAGDHPKVKEYMSYLGQAMEA